MERKIAVRRLEKRIMEIRRIEPLPAATIVGLIYAFMGFLWSIILLLGAGIGNATFFITPMFPASLGWLAIIFLPIVYGFFSFIITLIISWLYNLLSAKIGGIRIEL